MSTTVPPAASIFCLAATDTRCACTSSFVVMTPFARSLTFESGWMRPFVASVSGETLPLTA